ncbi:MAG: roadblock/LC7 domain-containing protein [Myxococcales bacterium]|nr:roadblock/LC7 domain-containing protein [Myxococcales bacterium]
MSPPPEILELPELCDRLQRDAGASGVLVLSDDGEILGHSGRIGELPDPVVEAVADLCADVVASVTRRELTDGDELVAEVGALNACAGALGGSAVLVVIFDARSKLGLVRLRMKRAREGILRSLETRG